MITINKILKFFSPKDEKFYLYFNEYATILVNASVELQKITRNKSISEEDVIKIKEFEREGDRINYTIQTELNKSFITPFDREDVQKLSSTIDDIMDYIYGIVQKMHDYDIEKWSIEYETMSDTINNCAMEIQSCMQKLQNIAKYKDEIFSSCEKIRMYESISDSIFHSGISTLFKTNIKKGADILELVKTKGILETFERCVDSAQDVADVIQTIIIKEV